MSSPIRHSRQQKVGPPRPPNWATFAGPTPQQFWSTNPRRTLPLDWRYTRYPDSRAVETHAIRRSKTKCELNHLGKVIGILVAHIASAERRASCPLRRDQRAVCFAPQAAGRPCTPLDHARSASHTARSSRARIRKVPHERRASVCGSAAALRSGFVPAVTTPALHFFCSPTAGRSTKDRTRWS